MTGCTCEPTEFPFRCPAMGRQINRTFHATCRTDPQFRALMCKAPPPPPAETINRPKPATPPRPSQDGSLCVHRKGWINDVEVKPCCSKPAYVVALYGCKVHRKCAQRGVGGQARACESCGDFSPMPDAVGVAKSFRLPKPTGKTARGPGRPPAEH